MNYNKNAFIEIRHIVEIRQIVKIRHMSFIFLAGTYIVFFGASSWSAAPFHSTCPTAKSNTRAKRWLRGENNLYCPAFS
jgi:hypothetical protein